MYSGCSQVRANLAACVGLLLCSFCAEPVVAEGATRDLSGYSGPEVAFTVSVAIDPPPGIGVVAVEDGPPPGWAVSNISDAGAWDSAQEKVKWGPFFDPSIPTFVTYDATPPPDATGEECFTGTVSFDGPSQSIGGDDCVGGSQVLYAAPGLPPYPEHLARKHRYLSIDPTTNPQTPSVLRVEVAEMMRCQNDPRRACLGVNDDCPMICAGGDPRNTLCSGGQEVCDVAGEGQCIDSGPCVDVAPNPPLAWLVDKPYQNEAACLAPGCDPAVENCCSNEDWVARLTDEVTADNTGTWQDWGMIHISDCAISPGITYAVFACIPTDITRCSEPLYIGTQQTPSGTPRHFGDIAGAPLSEGTPYEPPDGFVNVHDLSAWLVTKQNYGTPTLPQLHPTLADLAGGGVGVAANYILGLSDQQAIINHGLTWYLPWDNPTMLGGVDPSVCPDRLP